jgi:alanine racemase
MGWQGVQWNKALDVAEIIASCSNLYFKGLTTHFGNSDEPSNPQRYTIQKGRFRFTIDELAQANIHPELIHCANSGALLLDSSTHYDLIQPGITMYGLSPSLEVSQTSDLVAQLKPVLSWESEIAYINQIPRGEWVGYSQTWNAPQDTTLAIIPVGYYDGYDRQLGNQSQVIINDNLCPVIGRICMNLLMVDITGIKATIGDTVILIGDQNNLTITADDLARQAGTINYEITTRLPEHLERTFT